MRSRRETQKYLDELEARVRQIEDSPKGGGSSKKVKGLEDELAALRGSFERCESELRALGERIGKLEAAGGS